MQPIESQSEWESRRLWEKVAKGIKSGNYDEAAKDKTRIEVGLFVLSYSFLFHGSPRRCYADAITRMNNDKDAKMKVPLDHPGNWSSSLMSTLIPHTKASQPN